MNVLLPLLVALPLGAGFVIALLPKKYTRAPDFISIAAAGLILAGVAALFGYEGTYEIGAWPAPVGISLSFDAFSWIMLISISVLSFFVLLFSAEYMQKYTSRHNFYVLFMMMVAGMNGTLLAGDIFNRFVYVELAAIASYALVGFGCGSRELAAALKYAVLGALASSITILGIGLVYGLYGTVNMSHLRESIAYGGPVVFSFNALFLAIVLMTVGFAFKAALFPFHIWQPDALSYSPAPVAAMISGGLIASVGVYAMIRTVFAVFGITAQLGWLLASLGIISMVSGALLAATQKNYKKLFSYLSVSQIGYVFLGVGIGGQLAARGMHPAAGALAVTGGVFHLINQSVFNPLLFLSAETGLGRRKTPGWFVALLSLSGVPPLGGGISKIMIIAACFMAGYYFISFLAAIVAVFTFIMLKDFLFCSGDDKKKAGGSIPALMRIPVAGLSVLCIALALLALPVFRPLVLDPVSRSILDSAVPAGYEDEIP